MRLFQKYITAAILFLHLPVCVAKNFEYNLQKVVDDWRESNKVPGVVLLVNAPNYQGEFTSGFANLQKKAPITPVTLFGVGSITKTFISALILKLEAQGKLNINDPIGDYFPQYPRWKKITIKQLLNMTSGIFNYMDDKNYKKDLERNFAHRWGTNKLIDLSYHHPDNFKPGQGWGYNNTGYLLLGRIIEKVTHQPLSYVLNKEFFKPLEMSHTYYTENDYPPVIFEQLAKGYYNTKEVKASIGYNLGSSAGGIIMNGDDLANWISKLLVTKSLLPEKQLNEMLMGVRADKIKPEDSKFGLGIILTKRDKLGEIIWYTGVTPTHTAAYIWIPSKNVLIIALASFDRHGDKDYDLLFPQNELLSKVIDVLT